MEWPEPLDQDLPPPRQGEPAQLRSDILDEIADHLACAMDREREAGREERAAWRAVLERFGNPAQIVRKLWFEAMKEQIMRDRIVIVGVIVMSLALVFIAWSAWTSQQLSRNRELALIEAITQLRNAAQADQSTSDTLSSITFQIEPETAIPLQGTVLLQDSAGLERTQNYKGGGSVAFGPIPAGQYSYLIQPETTYLPNQGSLYVGLGDRLSISVPAKVDRISARRKQREFEEQKEAEVDVLRAQLDSLKKEKYNATLEGENIEKTFERAYNTEHAKNPNSEKLAQLHNAYMDAKKANEIKSLDLDSGIANLHKDIERIEKLQME